MISLFINIFRGMKKRLFQYFGIVMLLVIASATLSGLYSNSSRIESGFFTVINNSGRYDYRLKLKELNNYKNIKTATAAIKTIIEQQFVDPIIKEQIKNGLQENNIRNNTMPTITQNKPLDSKLERYLLNWGVNYQAIYLNNILENEVKNDPLMKNYAFVKSLFKTFDHEENLTSKKLFYTFEDGFYSKPDLNNFDFCPTRNGINQVYIATGKAPVNRNEVVINPQFAKINNISLNSTFSFLPKIEPLKVVGFGYAYWGITANSSWQNLNPTTKTTTPIYTTRALFNAIIADASYRANLENVFLLKVKNNDSYFIDKLQNVLIKHFIFNFGDIANLDSEDARSGEFLETIKMNNIVFAAITVVVLIVVIFIVLSYLRKEIDLQKPQIGLLKAFGYYNFKISFSFVFLFFLITLGSNFIGFGLGLPLQIWFNYLNQINFFIPLPTLFFSWITLAMSLIIVPIIFVIASYCESALKLKVNPLLLIYNRPNNTSSKWISFFKYPFRYWPFKQRLAVAFTLKSAGKLFLIFFTFSFVSFLLLFQTIATDLFDNKITNLNGYYNPQVQWIASTNSMFTYKNDQKLTVDKRIFDWRLQDKLDSAHELKADYFHIDIVEKRDRLLDIATKNDFKGYYMNDKEVNLLYQKTHDPTTPCEDWINPTKKLIPSDTVAKICETIKQTFDYLITTTGINPETTPLPGISLGLQIYDNNTYPTINILARAPSEWQNHQQGPLLGKRIKVTGLYNNLAEGLAWKNYFNFKSEKDRKLDLIFNTSHYLKQEMVTYTNNQGKIETRMAYVIPVAISKTLAILNEYQINNQFLLLNSWYNYTIPIIFDVKGIIANNLDNSTIYANLDDLRTAIGLVDNKGLLKDTFNFMFSKEKQLLPLNFLSISQPDANYNAVELGKKDFIVTSKVPIVLKLMKELLVKVFNGIRAIINITKILLLFGVIFVLIIVINMILENNLLIIAMMKSLGYRINEINRLITGSYIIALLVAFTFGTIISYVLWKIIIWIIVIKSGIIFYVPISAITILTSFGMIFLIMVIGYIVSLYLIKNKPVARLLQSG